MKNCLLILAPIVSITAFLDGNPESPYSNLRQLTFDGVRSGEGYFSRNDKSIVFQSENFNDNPFYQIYQIDLESGKTKLLTNGIGKTTCGWLHPSENKFLYSSTHLDPDAMSKQMSEIKKRQAGNAKKYSWDYDEHYDLFIGSLDSNRTQRITYELGYDAEGSISNDGNMVVFTSNRMAYTNENSFRSTKDLSFHCDLFLKTLDTNKTVQLTDTEGYDGGPFFNHEGTEICWRRFSKDGTKAEIYTMNLAEGIERKITDLGVMSWAPFFHPSNEYLIFSTNLHGFSNFELYIVDVEGRGEPVRVTNREGFDGLPSFSNSGDKICWTSNKTAENRSQLFLADWDHDFAKQLVQSTFSDADKVGIKNSQTAITSSDIKYFTEYLCDKKLAGRETGTEGMILASDFVAEYFREINLEPFSLGNWTQKFNFFKRSQVDIESELFLNNSSLLLNDAWSPNLFSDSGKFETKQLCFAGFGIRTKKSNDYEEFDSYVHLDVKNKWVVVLSGQPAGWSQKRKDLFYFHSTYSKKASVARDLGAIGIIIVETDESKSIEALCNSKNSIDHSISIKSLVLSLVKAKSMFKSGNLDLESLIDEHNNGLMQNGIELGNLDIKGSINIHKETGVGVNTLGWLRANPEFKSKKYIVIGAHLDHIGKNSLFSRKSSTDKNGFHPGADDNSSGIAALLEIVHYLKYRIDKKLINLNYDILFACWSGEEIGLIGSSHYVNSVFELSTKESTFKNPIYCYLNMDMIGRYKDKLTIHGVGSSSQWRKLIQQANVPVGLNLNLQNDSYVPTDTTSFITKKIPILSAFTGLHEDYHSPSDTPDKLNFEGIAKCAKLYSRLIEAINEEQYLDYVSQAAPKNTRTRLSAYLGTIPNYGQTDIKGVSISGVAENGPADLAGLTGDDIIIKLGDQKIESIYDYTDAIGRLTIGQPAEIEILRKSETIKLEITPASRK